VRDPAVNRGTLLVFEGLDGAGKSTQVAMLVQTLRDAGYEVCATREPSDGEAGRRIRALSEAGTELAPEDELALFVADRREHVRSCIEPELAAGHVVVCDRYYLSSVAYQGARGLEPEAILTDSEREFPIPDLVLLLTVDPSRGLSRVGERGGERNRSFERGDFLARAAQVFAGVRRDYVVRVDASGDPDQVHRAVVAAVRERTGLALD